MGCQHLAQWMGLLCGPRELCSLLHAADKAERICSYRHLGKLVEQDSFG